jgi:1-aminocyclopropane-1-carboxylate deaminase/D-cysteine desulfhydrase-like pyridoxal-dependent ACC family enzyme
MQADASRIQAFSVLAPSAKADEATITLTEHVLALIASDQQLDPDTIRIDDARHGDGYDIPTQAMYEAARLLAWTEGRRWTRSIAARPSPVCLPWSGTAILAGTQRYSS